MTGDSRRLRETWESWAENDPLFAILSDPTKLGGKWDIDEFMAHTPELEGVLETTRRHGLLNGHGRALDFGCGVGRMTQALAHEFDAVVGIDISDAMIERARALNRFGDHCRYVSGSLDQLPAGTFDFVFSIYVMQHIPRSMQAQILKELVRLLTPAGTLAVQIAAVPPGLAGYRARFAPRWLKEMRFKRRFGGAPLIEMNQLRASEVTSMVAPAVVRLIDGEWYFIQPAPTLVPRS